MSGVLFWGCSKQDSKTAKAVPVSRDTLPVISPPAKTAHVPVPVAVPKPPAQIVPDLPAYAPELMPAAGPVHRGLAVASTRTLKGTVVAISPDNLSAITVPYSSDTVYVEAVFARGKWDGETFQTGHRIKGATFDRTEQKIMLAVAHRSKVEEQNSLSFKDESSLYLYDLVTKKGTFVPLATEKFAPRTFLSWSVDNALDVACENGWFVVNLDTLAVRAATPEERARRENLMPKTPPLVFEKGFVRQPGSFTKRAFPGGEFFAPDVIWENAVAVAARGTIYYLKVESPYWPWGGSAQVSAGSAEMSDEVAKLERYLAHSGYAGDGKWEHPPLEAEIFRPRINPLNGRPTGPDVSAKVAAVRLTKRSDGGIGFIIDESYQNAKQGDVIANIRDTDSWAIDWRSPEGFYLEIVQVER
jgi:hypothetical protein